MLGGGAYLIWGDADSIPAIDPEPGTEPVDEKDPAEAAARLVAEWEQRNEELKKELGPYYVPLPHPLEKRENPPVKVRGIFFTGRSIAYQDRYERMMKLIAETELNAMVIDIKDDKGRMAYHSNIEAVNEQDAYYEPLPLTDIKATLKELHDQGIYTIGRIVVYRDSEILPERRPEWCIPLKGGGLYRDAGFAYGNPFIEELWDYNIAIAKEAALLGFNEIQFDYIRFPDKAAYLDTVADFPGRNGRSKAEAIRGFMKKAYDELKPYNVFVSFDVFGVVANSWGDADDIGQIWEDCSHYSDYICPMIYPSHYFPVRQSGSVVPYWFGLRFPDTNPAVTITGALTDAIKRNAKVENPAILRPWLQAFTANWLGGMYGPESYITYGPEQIRAQIDAALALGIDEYLLWDANNENYPRAAFYTDEEANRRAEQKHGERVSKGCDYLNRTAAQSVEAYLEAIQNRNWRNAYAMQRMDRLATGGDQGNIYYDWFYETRGRLESWQINGEESDGEKAIVELTIIINAGGEEIALENERWEVELLNHLWQVKPSARFLQLMESKEDITEQG